MIPRIRPLAPRDKPAIVNILKASPEFELHEIDVAAEVIDDYIRDPVHSGYHISVAELDNTIEGYICYGPTPLTKGTWDIYWIAVSPVKKRKGIGKDLLAFAEHRIGTEQGRLILVETSSKPSYEGAHGFYATMGYELVSRISDFYSPKDDKLIFQKRLTA